MRNTVTAKVVGKFDIFVHIAVVLRAVLGTGKVQTVCFLVAILNIIMNSYWIQYTWAMYSAQSGIANGMDRVHERYGHGNIGELCCIQERKQQWINMLFHRTVRCTGATQLVDMPVNCHVYWRRTPLCTRAVKQGDTTLSCIVHKSGTARRFNWELFLHVLERYK
jgi:hypothetical protein